MKAAVMLVFSCVLALPGCRARTTGAPASTAEPSAEPSAPTTPAADIDMEERERQIEQALLAFSAEQYNEADVMLSWLAEQPPEDPRVLGTLGLLRLQQEQPQEALKALNAALKLAPEDPHLHFALARTYEALDRIDDAIGAYRIAHEALNEDSAVGMSLGRALLMVKQYEHAERVVREVLEVNPRAKQEGVGGYTLLGDALREQGRHDEAIKAHMKAQTTLASDKRAHAGAAQSYDALGDTLHAIDEWAAYIRMDCCSEFSRTVAQRYIMDAQADER